MVDETRKKLLKVLVALAWADGRVDAEEMEIVYAVLDSFEADQETVKEFVTWAKEPRSLDDVDLSDLSPDDAELVLYQAVVLSFIDGEQSEKEVSLLKEFVNRLGLSKAHADAVLASATARARELLPILEA
jgi:tellurite resistance protein